MSVVAAKKIVAKQCWQKITKHYVYHHSRA